jgi:predicted house-cleaning noncanonical NTP pyrophosphatase (MazG superfamily)
MIGSLGYSFAQSGNTQAREESKTMEERIEARTSRMTEELALNTEQASKVRELQVKQAQKIKAVRAKKAAENQQFRQQVRAIAEETEKAYQAILTSEQFEKYKQNKAQQKQNRNSGKKRHKFRNSR